MSESQNELWARLHQSEFRVSQATREEEMLELLRQMVAKTDELCKLIKERG